MQCYKCKLFTKTFKIPEIEDNHGLPVCLCGSCAVKFINKLCEWKDLDLREELEVWVKGV